MNYDDLPSVLPAMPPPTANGPMGNHTCEIGIPNSMIGSIIGRAGSRINEIRLNIVYYLLFNKKNNIW